MYDYLIYDQLKKYAGSQKSFHVPGHKARGEFRKMFPVAPLDVTELSWSDNLQCPAGVIAAAQREVAEILGARRSYFLTDGSSAGVMAMMYAASRRGNKIIVPRNCHQSVWNACSILGLEPVVIQGEIRHDILLPPDPAQLERLLVNDVNIVGMIVTHPDYYGNTAPLADYSRVLKKHARLLLVDEAHGAHFGLEPARRGYAGLYADIWVDGAHKSLPTLTQGSLLSVRDDRFAPDVEEGLQIFRTTSPGYPIMASVEYGVKYLKNNPKVLEQAKIAAAAFRVKASSLKLYSSDDWTKVAVDCKPLGISSHEGGKFLEKKGIYAELSDGRYLIFYLSPLITANDLNGLHVALLKMAANKKLKGTYVPRPAFPTGERTYSYQYAIKNPSEYVPLKQSVGRMCARNVGFTPPCIPVLIAGETVTEAHIRMLEKADHTFGLTDGYLRVVKA